MSLPTQEAAVDDIKESYATSTADDGVEYIFELRRRIAEGKGKDAPYQESWDDLSLSDAEIVKCIEERPVLRAGDFWPRAIYQLCPDAAVKVGQLNDSEWLSSELVRTSTNILVPRVHRVIPHAKISNYVYMVMEWVPGRTVDECWGELSVWRKMKVTWTLRSYVRQMRRIPNPTPGRVGPLGHSSVGWFGPFFGEQGAGPFSSYEAMVAWLNKRLDSAKSNPFAGAPASTPPFDTSYPLVFTHGDLKADNLLLDEDDRLWVLDFGQSGFYPAPFEYCSTWGSWRSLFPYDFITHTFTAIVTGFYYAYDRTMYGAMHYSVWVRPDMDD